ncbi:eukaryotic translation initiation factor 2A [Uranotaenia lowii]|uniref:eukaryotic translation initiation factor 2A n=1 Tax=Uranotaenia lowii TaxID=190385 RepID=UPI00247855E3|nr:eukaryotic translation initiation factor 2A [Uranotaenia lowii]
MATELSPSLAIRSSTGVEVWKSSGFKAPFVPETAFTRDESKLCRAIVYSPNGRFLAWANGSTVQICTAANWKVLHRLPRPKAFYLKFSPRSTYLMTWEIYTENPKDDIKEKPNLFLYDVASGQEVFSVIQKRHADWEMHWAADESLMVVMVGGEVLFYEVKPEAPFPDKPIKRLVPPGYRSSAQTKDKRQNKSKKQNKPNEATSSAPINTNNKSSNGQSGQSNRSSTAAGTKNSGNSHERKARPKTAPVLNSTPGEDGQTDAVKKTPQLSGDPEKDKKIKNIKKKLKDITLLKEKNDRGDKLEQNQIAKMNSEAELLKELKALKTS